MTSPKKEFRYTTEDLAEEFGITPKTLRKKAGAIGIGINRAGRAGFLYSEADRLELIKFMRPDAPVPTRHRGGRGRAA